MNRQGPSIAILEATLDFFPTAGPQGMADAIAKCAYFFTTTALLQGTGNFICECEALARGDHKLALVALLYAGTRDLSNGNHKWNTLHRTWI